MSSDDILVQARALGKTYTTPSGSLDALHAVDAAFARGEITALVGASGSGKSTFLRAIAGLDRPTAGELVVNGLELRTASAAALRRHRDSSVTYVSQKAADNFVPHLTLAEHAHDSPGDAVSLLESVGLAHRLGSRPAELSGGEQARAAFALALARDTPLIVIDEPTAELDLDSVAPLLETIHSHAHAGAAFIIATHDPSVTEIADSVLRLDRGRVLDAGMLEAQAVGVSNEPGTDVVLEAKGLSKSFRRGSTSVRAVDDLSLEVRHGELGILLGRSGSGKSTVLTLFAGWQEPDDGAIDSPFTGANATWANVGYMPQRFGLFPELTVRENVELPARLTHRPELAERARELLERLGLDELADRRPPETSIGQQQRTALARALLLEPAVLLADEPSSHQDAGWRDAVWELLQEAAGAGTACLIATHETQVADFATRVWKLEGGAIV